MHLSIKKKLVYLSASSKTTYSIELSLRFISTLMCKKRPGVAIILGNE